VNSCREQANGCTITAVCEAKSKFRFKVTIKRAWSQVRSLILIILTAPLCAQTTISGSGKISGGAVISAACGPPLYLCSRSDSNTVAAPTNPPQVGPNACIAGSLTACGNLTGANTVVTDPDFGNKIVRITDSNTDTGNSTMLASCGGAQGDQTWNTNSTLLVVCTTGGRSYPMAFNPNTMQAELMYVGASGFPNGYFIGNSLSWSRANPYLGYVLAKTAIEGYCFADLVAGACPSTGPLDTTTPPSTGNGRIYTVYDFASSNACLGTAIFPSGFTPNWSNWGQPSAGDASFSAGWAYDISGTANVTNGSTDVTWASGTVFDKRYLAGNTFVLGGVTYHISSINSTTDITLTTAYTGTTGTATYTLRGEQGTGVNLTVYVPGSGCTMLNTETGLVTSDFGAGGTIGIPDRWTMHVSFSTAGSTWAYAGVTTCLITSCPNSFGMPYFWQIGTINVRGCLGLCHGHYTEAAGYSNVINNSTNPYQTSFDIRRFENGGLAIASISVSSGTATIAWSGNGPTFIPGQEVYIKGSSVGGCNAIFTLLTASTFSAGSCTSATGGTASVFTPISNTTAENNVPIPWDQHPSWNNVDVNDTYYFITSTFCNAANGCAVPYTTPLEDEVYGKKPSTGLIARFAHTFNSDQSQTFITSEAIGQVSQDGRFFLFASDWLGTLGSTAGATTCTLGTNCRGDVFAVKLQ